MADRDGFLYVIPEHLPGGGATFVFPTEESLTDVDFLPAEKTVRDYTATLHSISQGVIGDYLGFFLNRFWITPNPIEFGSVVGNKEIDVGVLNTYEQNQVLNSVDLSALGEGVSITNNVPPVNFPFLSNAILRFTATPFGPPSFSGNALFNFGSGTVPILATGRRLVLFWYEPEQPLVETLTWVTDIQRTRNGDETRDSLRTTPRQVLQMRIRGETEAEVAQLRNTLDLFRSFSFGVPIWQERRQVTAPANTGALAIGVNTVGVDHRELSSIIVWEPATRTFFDTEIASFTDSAITLSVATSVAISADAVIVPLRSGFITSDPVYQDAAVGIQETLVEFETTDNVDLSFIDQTALEAVFTVHPTDGLPVITSYNMLTGGTQGRTQNDRQVVIDSNIGIPFYSSQSPRGSLVSSKNTKLTNLASIRKYRSLLHWLHGSWGSFYMPTFRNDFPLTTDLDLSITTFIVKNTNTAAFFALGQPHKSIFLELPDGRTFIAEIATISQETPTTESITLVSPFSADVETVSAEGAVISWLELMRVEADTATFIHNFVDINAELRFQTRTVQR